MEEKERYYYKEYAGDYDILDRNDKNAYYGAISRDEEDAQNLINLLNQQDKENQQLKQQVEELKGERLKFYTDDVRRTKVINGVHFDIEQLLVFSEYVEHEKNISADKENKISQLKQQLALTEKALELLKDTKNYYAFVNENTETIDIDKALKQAQKEVENE